MFNGKHRQGKSYSGIFTPAKRISMNPIKNHTHTTHTPLPRTWSKSIMMKFNEITWTNRFFWTNNFNSMNLLRGKYSFSSPPSAELMGLMGDSRYLQMFSRKIQQRWFIQFHFPCVMCEWSFDEYQNTRGTGTPCTTCIDSSEAWIHGFFSGSISIIIYFYLGARTQNIIVKSIRSSKCEITLNGNTIFQRWPMLRGLPVIDGKIDSSTNSEHCAMFLSEK